MRRCEKAHFTIQNTPFRVMICTISAPEMRHIAVRNGAFRNAIRFLSLHIMHAIAHNTHISNALKLHVHIRDICAQEYDFSENRAPRRVERDDLTQLTIVHTQWYQPLSRGCTAGNDKRQRSRLAAHDRKKMCGQHAQRHTVRTHIIFFRPAQRGISCPSQTGTLCAPGVCRSPCCRRPAPREPSLCLPSRFRGNTRICRLCGRHPSRRRGNSRC